MCTRYQAVSAAGRLVLLLIGFGGLLDPAGELPFLDLFQDVDFHVPHVLARPFQQATRVVELGAAQMELQCDVILCFAERADGATLFVDRHAPFNAFAGSRDRILD